VSTSEYVSLFVSIIVGLALTDLLISLHRIIRVGRRVRWYWLVPLLSIYLLLAVVAFWWGSYVWYLHIHTLTMGQFLPTLLAAIAIFLLAAAILPDEVPDAGLDLKIWYVENARQMWILASLALLLVVDFYAVEASPTVTAPCTSPSLNGTISRCSRAPSRLSSRNDCASTRFTWSLPFSTWHTQRPFFGSASVGFPPIEDIFRPSSGAPVTCAASSPCGTTPRRSGVPLGSASLRVSFGRLIGRSGSPFR